MTWSLNANVISRDMVTDSYIPTRWYDNPFALKAVQASTRTRSATLTWRHCSKGWPRRTWRSWAPCPIAVRCSPHSKAFICAPRKASFPMVQFRLDDMMRSFIHIVRNNFPMMCPHDVEEISQNLSQNQDPWRTWDDRFLTSIFSNFRDDFLHHVNAFVHHAFENPKFAIAYSQRRG